MESPRQTLIDINMYKYKPSAGTVRQGEGVQDVPWGGLPGDGTPETRNSLFLSLGLAS